MLKFFKNKKEIKIYRIGKYSLVLKANHNLDVFQKTFPLYDRFLPLLCSKLEGLIIDVGANVGDTSVAVFAQNKKSFVVGVEPDKDFFDECMCNIVDNNLTERFLGINKFLTTTQGKFVINKDVSSSTGSMQKDKLTKSIDYNSISFSELMNLIPVDKKVKFDVLKTDTDGFDWDILNSFTEYAKSNDFLPRYIYFEMQTFLNGNEKNAEGRNEIIENYITSMNKLVEIGYTNFCLFDNYGTHIKKIKSVIEIFELVDYIKRSQLFNNHSTIFYLDVLAYSEKEEIGVDFLLNELYAQ